MNNAKICSNRRGIRINLAQLAGTVVKKTHLPEIEREFGVVDLSWLDSRGQHGHFSRPYPYAHGDYSDGHEEYEWKPTTDGFPVYLECVPGLGKVASGFRMNLTILWQTLACIALQAAKSPSSQERSR